MTIGTGDDRLGDEVARDTAELRERFAHQKDTRGAAVEDLVAEAERGYCTEHLGGTHYCLKPAAADVTGPGGGLKCEQHVLGWPESVVRGLS